MEVFANLPEVLRHRIYALAADDYVIDAIRKFESPWHAQACWVVAVQPDGGAMFLSRGLTDPINTGDWRRCSDGARHTSGDWFMRGPPVRPADGSRLFGVLGRCTGDDFGRRKVATAASNPDLHSSAASMFLTLHRLHRAHV